MNGVHDMGGMHGFGKVEPEPNEPVFHAPWEGRVLAMQRAMTYTGEWNIDMSRAAQEGLPPPLYLGVSYYKRWALGMERNLLGKGLVSADELAAGRAMHPPKPVKRTMATSDVSWALTRGKYGRPSTAPARFSIGERVRAKNMHPPTHTRLPRYVRGHVGIIERIQGCHVFPDSVTTGAGENPQWLYTVVFDGRELWGPDSDPTVKVSVEAFEPYLEPA
jgi:nitrile hydratase subunit beta